MASWNTHPALWFSKCNTSIYGLSHDIPVCSKDFPSTTAPLKFSADFAVMKKRVTKKSKKPGPGTITSCPFASTNPRPSGHRVLSSALRFCWEKKSSFCWENVWVTWLGRLNSHDHWFGWREEHQKLSVFHPMKLRRFVQMFPSSNAVSFGFICGKLMASSHSKKLLGITLVQWRKQKTNNSRSNLRLTSKTNFRTFLGECPTYFTGSQWERNWIAQLFWTHPYIWMLIDVENNVIHAS